MSMQAHTLPSEDDARHARRARPDGQPWTLADLTDETMILAPEHQWNSEGIIIVEDFFDDALIDRYLHEWALPENNGPLHHHPDGTVDAPRIGGYNETGYLRAPVLMEICTNQRLADLLAETIGEPAGVHLNLSGLVTTARQWHSDYGLNPAHVGDSYAAAWICLQDQIDANAGPYQYIPGSHMWPGVVTQERCTQVIDLRDPRWPAQMESVLTPLVEAEAASRNAEIVTYLPKRGTLALWNSRLYHRGSPANIPGLYRGALIAHFSGVSHRTDMPPAVRHPLHGGFYFPLGPLGEGV